MIVAEFLLKAGINSANDLISTETTDLVTNVRVIQDNQSEKIEQITAVMVNEWKDFKEKLAEDGLVKEGI